MASFFFSDVTVPRSVIPSIVEEVKKPPVCCWSKDGLLILAIYETLPCLDKLLRILSKHLRSPMIVYRISKEFTNLIMSECTLSCPFHHQQYPVHYSCINYYLLFETTYRCRVRTCNRTKPTDDNFGRLRFCLHNVTWIGYFQKVSPYYTFVISMVSICFVGRFAAFNVF